MEALLERVTSLEAMVSQLVKWTNYKPENQFSIPGKDDDMVTYKSSSSPPCNKVDSDDIDIEHTIKVEYQNEDIIALPTNFSPCEESEEWEEGELRIDETLGDIPDPNYSSVRDNSQPQVFIGGPPKKRVPSPPKSPPQSRPVSVINWRTRLNKTNRTGKSESETRFPCSTCGKIFLQKHLVVRHALAAHKTTPFPCRLCSRKFLKKEDLDQHVGHHTNYMTELHNFKCAQCALNFDTHDDLDSHIRSSHAAIKHQCSFCGREFKYKATLTRHVELHRNTLG